MIKNILFDFDGVILDSMPIREYGFREIFKNYDALLVEELLEYHNKNGGLSRYVKIRYFYEKLLHKDISDDEVNKIADEFSSIMKQQLTDKKYLIKETTGFIKNNYKKYNFHIVSGSDEKELVFLCQSLGIDKYFITINGSPTIKNDLVKYLLKRYEYNNKETILIGDSINDYDAAIVNDIVFYGFNNPKLKQYGNYIESFEELSI
jgi:phosphoglycolate phosphatase-like HAD superfamily hydrolase